MANCDCMENKCIIDGGHECVHVGELNELGFPKEHCCACWQIHYSPDFTPKQWCQQCRERIYGDFEIYGELPVGGSMFCDTPFIIKVDMTSSGKPH